MISEDLLSQPELDSKTEKKQNMYVIYINGIPEFFTDRKYKTRRLVKEYISRISLRYQDTAKIFTYFCDPKINTKYPSKYVDVTMIDQNFLFAQERPLCTITVKRLKTIF